MNYQKPLPRKPISKRLAQFWAWLNERETHMLNRPFITDSKARDYKPIVDLPEGWLACKMCGLALPPDEQNEVMNVQSFGRILPWPASIAERKREYNITLSYCGDCTLRKTKAAQLATEFPSACVANGIIHVGSLATNAVESALAVLASLGEDPEITQPKSLRLLLENTLSIAHSLTWAGRLTPFIERGAKPETGAARPWSHLTEAQLSAARQSTAQWLQARIEQPVPLAPLHGAGCYMCGIGSIEALPSRIDNVWKETHIVPRHAGGTSSEKVAASVCATCWAEFQRTGGWGMSLRERLVLRAAKINGGLGVERIDFDHLPAWGVTDRTKPNASPWAHINLEKLVADIQGGAFL